MVAQVLSRDVPSAAACNPLFDAAWYRQRNPDVVAAGVDPWQHFLSNGAAELRSPNPLFDCAWYLTSYPGVSATGMNPLLHYWYCGAESGYDPNPVFDSAWYLQSYPDVRHAGMNPLLHYLRHGAREGRDPAPGFSGAWYRRAYPELCPGGLTPLGDYLLYGHLEGRSPLPSTPRSVRGRPEGFGRIAVYTAITADYDCLKVPGVVDADCDYYCFTDRDISWQNVWRRRDLTWRHADPVRESKYVKHHPHEYFPDHEWSIWLDGNLQLECSPYALLPGAASTWDMANWRHPERDCLYAEGEICMAQDKDVRETIQAQLSRYRALGHPERAGLHENGVLVRRHMAMVDFAQAWWREIDAGSRRDQLCFDFVRRQLPLRLAYLGAPGTSVRDDPRVSFFRHSLPRGSDAAVRTFW